MAIDRKSKNRIALNTYFFLLGFGFSSWASRIPNIKEMLGLNEAELGSILIAMPISSLVGIPVSGWLVSKFDSRVPMIIGVVVQCICLIGIGFVNSVSALVGFVFFYAFFVRIGNIAANTQAIFIQKQFEKKINGSFHGLWSVGGIMGILLTSFMVSLEMSTSTHFMIASGTIILISIISYSFYLVGDKSTQPSKLQLGKPDPQIVSLGILIFCAAICEGGMFDWSGIYFKEVVGAEIFTLGYLIFMAFMAFSRFFSDRLIDRIGMKKLFIFSAICLAGGLAIAVAFPNFWMAMIGFSIVGIGTASIVPMTMLLAGNHKKYSPGVALSIISTYGIMGVFIGPPVIGYLAHLMNLGISFLFVAGIGLLIIPVSRYYFKISG
ncbi:MAG: MFS transporter [Cyclobacteriaceae bacterium]